MNKTILIADDSRLMRMALGRLLRLKGHKVVEAVHGLAGAEALDYYDLDLIITDLNMPILDGMGLVRAVRSHPRAAGVPVIMASGEDSPERRRQARQAGVNFWLNKPIDADRLNQIVEWALALGEGELPDQALPGREGPRAVNG